MKRREFLGTALAAGVAGATSPRAQQPAAPAPGREPGTICRFRLDSATA